MRNLHCGMVRLHFPQLENTSSFDKMGVNVRRQQFYPLKEGSFQLKIINFASEFKKASNVFDNSKGQSKRLPIKAPDIEHEFESVHPYAYNLGAIIYEMITKEAFDYNISELKPNQAPDDLMDLFIKITHKEQDQRLSMDQVLEHAFLQRDNTNNVEDQIKAEQISIGKAMPVKAGAEKTMRIFEIVDIFLCLGL